MALRTLLAVTTLASSAIGGMVPAANDCRNERLSPEFLAAARKMMTEEANVVSWPMDVQPEDGYLSYNDVKTTLDGVNKDYAGSGFQFELKNIDHTINGKFSREDEAGMKKQLRKGDYQTLNPYYLPTMSDNCYCYYPTSNKYTKEVLDGCVMRSDTYDNGQTTTHEIGHWLGLAHTFDGEEDCDPDNDFVADTPALINHWSCDKDSNTCPDMPGKDPVNNFMSYGTCSNEFTQGQQARMASMYSKYRA